MNADKGRKRLSVEMAEEHVAGKHADDYAPYCYRCQYFEERAESASWHLAAIEKRRAWRMPSRPSPLLGIGSDEFNRTTLWIGRTVIALWRCHCSDCEALVDYLRRAEMDGSERDRKAEVQP